MSKYSSILSIKEAYNKVALELYAKWGYRNSLYNDRLERFVGLLSPEQSILDLGCGFGRDVYYFSNKGIQCEGIDVSEEMIQLGHKIYGNINISVGNIFDIATRYKGRKFNGVWIRGVLFHYPICAYEKIFLDIQTILDEYGYLYIQITDEIPGNYTRGISDTNSSINYYFYSKEKLLQEITEKYFEVFLDISTQHDICLILKLR